MIEIKRLIEQLRSAAKLEAYYNSEYNGLYNHAANALEELQAELEQVKEERDVAVEYLRGQCRYCKRNLVCTSRKGPHSNCWEWRGLKEE